MCQLNNYKHMFSTRAECSLKDGLPLLGQAYNMFKSPPMELYISWMRKWPDAPLIRFMDVGNREVVLLNSVKTTKEVLQTNCYTFVKPAFLRRVLGEITGTGLLFAEGEAHQKQRRLLTGEMADPLSLLYIAVTNSSHRAILPLRHQGFTTVFHCQS